MTMKTKTYALLVLLFAAFALGLASAQVESVPKPTVEQYEKALPLIVQQRNQLSAALLDTQAQLGLAAQEIDALKKQVAELQAKLAPPAPTKTPEPQPAKK